MSCIVIACYVPQVPEASALFSNVTPIEVQA